MSKFSSPFMAKSPLNNGKYNKVNVQDLQDMGEVKKNKKGKYVVNENPTTSRDTLYIPKNTKSYTGKKIKVGSLIDESDYEDISAKSPLFKVELTKREKRKAQKAGKASGKSEKEGISEKRRKRLVEKSNKKYMKAADAKTYFRKNADGNVSLRSTPKVSAISSESGKAYKKQISK